MLPEEVDDPAGHQLGVAAEEGKYPSELLALVGLFHVAVVPGPPPEGVVDEDGDEKAGRVEGVADVDCYFWWCCYSAIVLALIEAIVINKCYSAGVENGDSAMSLYTSRVGRPTLRAPIRNVSLSGFTSSIFTGDLH